jgi:two-component system OmpR family response regulator
MHAKNGHLIAIEHWETSGFVPQAHTLPSAPVDAMRILVVEDDKKIASFLVKGLKQNGYAVDQAPDGEAGLRLAETTPYDAAVLDLMLPKLDGLSLLRQLRRQKINLPVLILSAKASVDNRIAGLQAGGDDYLVKPFSFSELLARLQALIRRATSAAETTTWTVGDLTLNLATREVTRAGRQIELQTKEFALLEYLLRHAGKVVSKTMILEHVWDYSFDPQTNVVDVAVCRLRNKIDRDFNPPMIHTLRGVGYVLKPG